MNGREIDSAFAPTTDCHQVLADQAPDLLEKIIHDRDDAAATHVRALTAALKFSHYAIELDDFADRLNDLERFHDIILKKRSEGGVKRKVVFGHDESID